MNEKYIKMLFELSNKSLKNGDVPVGAIIVKDGRIISKGYNKREKNSLITSHAEIDTILKANKKLHSYFLYDCELYVTLKPCDMCQKVINNSRIKKVYYLLDKLSTKNEYQKTSYILINNDASSEYKKMLSNFFNKLR